MGPELNDRVDVAVSTGTECVEVSCGLAEKPCGHGDRHISGESIVTKHAVDQRSTGAAVSIGERVNRLELAMDDLAAFAQCTDIDPLAKALMAHAIDVVPEADAPRWTRMEERSLSAHRQIAARLLQDPATTLRKARLNLSRLHAAPTAATEPVGSTNRALSPIDRPIRS